MAPSYVSLVTEANSLLEKFSASRQCLDDFIEDASKDLQFLRFFFTNLDKMQEEWNKIYDSAFVDKHWIGPLLRWRPEINKLLDELSLKLSRGYRVKKGQIKTTQPRKFFAHQTTKLPKLNIAAILR
ncbi:cilia- and flagella-associated protein 99 isoform X2 [Xyrichtys novacula]|uniref:Cilia- and flagella-associated protein 99 isoform X2 n=1 Tax=Xyrichtys novacula TaxID=13765 RepID=A0AAV1GKD1_XYRNO|nr:cilia- and flagella-associated protein 99 isoform X2 [Xyrichtys novacula]